MNGKKYINEQFVIIFLYKKFLVQFIHVSDISFIHRQLAVSITGEFPSAPALD